MVKVWPWESIEQSFSLKNDEINMASLLVEKSFIDLRAQVTVNGVCALSHADVHFILADNSRGKVWSAGYQSFALWDARTRELVKVFNIDGQVSRADKPPARDPCVEDDTKTKISSSSKKDKSQNSLNFLQRSRNALLGAADVVRRVAGKGAFGDDHRTESMVLTGDGMIWTGCSNGLLVQWDGNGTRLRDFNHHPFSVKCLCAFGARMWVGYVTGTIQVLNLDGSVLGEWISHNSPIIDMAVGAGYVFTLSNHGGIRGWNITSPGPLDDMLRSEVANKESLYTQVEKLNLMVGTWNVGQGKASHDSLIMWLSSAAEDASIIVVGLQEVEMGAGFLAISAARETVGIEGTSIGQWWLDTLGKNLDEGSTFERIGSRQLAGLLIALWVRKNLRPHIGDIDVAAVPCGLGHAIGNKGAVGLRIRVYDRVMCFVNCHLAAHLEAVNKRNADFNHIYRTMSFNKPNQINASSGTFLAKWIARGEINRSPLHLSVDEGLIVSALGTAARTYNHTLLDGSWAILRRSLRQRRPPLAESYLGRIFALASLGNLQRAFTALNEFESVYGQSTTTDAEELFSPFTSLSPLVVACTKQGFETLDKVYFELEKLSKADPPYKSVAALNCIVLGCANIWDVDRAYQTFEAISGSFELTPDIHSYNALLCAFGKQNKIREATGVFNHLVGLNVKPNATTYSLLVDAHLVNRDPPAALSVIDDMVAAGLTPTKEILKKVRRRCVREFDEASDVRVIDIAEKFKLRLGGENRRNMLFDLNYGTTYS